MAAVSCPSCGAVSAPGATQCASCGRTLVPAQGPGPAYAAQPAYPPQYGAAPPAAYAAPAYSAPYGAPYPPAYGAAPYGAPAYGYYPPPYVMYQPAYAMPITPEMRMGGIAMAARGARTGAAALDFLAVLGLWAVLFFLVYPSVFRRNGFWDPFDFSSLPFRIPITLLCIILYYGVPDGLGASLGKRAMGLRVVTLDGRPIGLLRGLGRAVEVLMWFAFCFLSVFGIIIAVVLQSHLLGKNGQGVGDRIAKCYVVRKSDIARG